MNLTPSSLRCALQVALLGEITSNIRAIDVTFNEQNVTLYFYYEFPPSEEEEEDSEVISTEVLAQYIEVYVDVKRFTFPLSKSIPHQGMRVYQRMEHL